MRVEHRRRPVAGAVRGSGLEAARDRTREPAGDRTRDPAREPAREREDRSLLIGLSAFEWLKRVQATAPAPRMDLRYFVEGAIEVLQEEFSAREDWLQASRSVLREHLAGTTAQTRPGEAGAHRSRDESDSGTGRAPRASAEGVAVAAGAQAPDDSTARAQGALRRAGGHHADCRSLLIGEAGFRQLKAIQGTTHDPRLEMRYLIEGACALLRQRADLHGTWLAQARQALQRHLTHLQQLPPQPFLEFRK